MHLKKQVNKINDMKKILLSLLAICFSLGIYAQGNPIDEMFDKYSDKAGFTVVSISSKMFSMFAGKENKDPAAGDIVNRLKSINILSVEDSLLNRNLNFYTELSKKLNLSEYEELMVVKGGPDVTKFLIRQKGDVITELLVVTGGPGGIPLYPSKEILTSRVFRSFQKQLIYNNLKPLMTLRRKIRRNRI